MNNQKLSELVQRWVIIHECGHIFSILLFTQVNLQYKSIDRIFFAHKNTERPAYVSGEPVNHTIGSRIFDDNSINRKFLRPILIGYASGYIFEEIFNCGKNFWSRLNSISLVERNGDRESFDSLLKTISIENLNANREFMEQILSSYKEFLIQRKSVLEHVVNTLTSDTSYLNQTNGFVFEGHNLQSLLSAMKNKIDSDLVEEFRNWYTLQTNLLFPS